MGNCAGAKLCQTGLNMQHSEAHYRSRALNATPCSVLIVPSGRTISFNHLQYYCHFLHSWGASMWALLFAKWSSFKRCNRFINFFKRLKKKFTAFIWMARATRLYFQNLPIQPNATWVKPKCELRLAVFFFQPKHRPISRLLAILTGIRTLVLQLIATASQICQRARRMLAKSYILIIWRYTPRLAQFFSTCWAH